MKEQDYINVQALTRLRIAMDVLKEAAIFDKEITEAKKILAVKIDEYFEKIDTSK